MTHSTNHTVLFTKLTLIFWQISDFKKYKKSFRRSRKKIGKRLRFNYAKWLRKSKSVLF
jgi:hypothetical protein